MENQFAARGVMGALKHFLLCRSQIIFWRKKILPSCLQGCTEGYIQISKQAEVSFLALFWGTSLHEEIDTSLLMEHS